VDDSRRANPREDQTLVFLAAEGTGVSVADADVASQPMHVEIAVSNGALSLRAPLARVCRR